MTKLIFACCLIGLISCTTKRDNKIELIDLHVHIKGDLSIEEAIQKSKSDGVKYGIAANCGLGFPIQTDAQIDSFVNFMHQYPQFYLGMQAEGREWLTLFSKEALEKFDYVFTDAMTFTDVKGRRNRIWIKEETWIDDEEQFMDYLVETAERIIRTEPIDIYVNPTYLPEQLANRYDQFWTAERMMKLIDAAKEKGVAIEINNRFKIPSEKFIKLAKAAGVKFTIGTNNIDKSFTKPYYALEMIEKCGLKYSDFWVPEKKQ
jgi:histidinol phosphatase-like PHP family hydrolase